MDENTKDTKDTKKLHFKDSKNSKSNKMRKKPSYVNKLNGDYTRIKNEDLHAVDEGNDSSGYYRYSRAVSMPPYIFNSSHDHEYSKSPPSDISDISDEYKRDPALRCATHATRATRATRTTHSTYTYGDNKRKYRSYSEKPQYRSRRRSTRSTRTPRTRYVESSERGYRRRGSSYKQYKNIYCSNCNGRGHLFKECKKPIRSFGIIAFRKRKKTNEIQVCLIRRKNTISYEAFVRGKYKLDELPIHLERMTLYEKEKIQRIGWEDLYSEICYLRSSKHASRERKKAKDLYDSIDVNDVFKDSSSDWVTPEWEFPKGRKYFEETQSECALREFREETNINEREVEILEIEPLVETFEGTNKRMYQNQYFVSIVDSDSPEPYIDLNSRNQITEIGDVDWFSIEDALGLIRNYHKRKKDILLKAYMLAKNIL